jgi:tRNA(Arg) A34 adenosine deaminase TadA
MKKALQEAEMALIKAKFPLAIIVVNDRVIARSHNLTKFNDVTAHAEKRSPLRQII